MIIFRLYHNLQSEDLELLKFESEFVNQFELCDVNQNPMFGNASVLYPTLWRFFPVLDDQVKGRFLRKKLDMSKNHRSPWSLSCSS